MQYSGMARSLNANGEVVSHQVYCSTSAQGTAFTDLSW